MVGAVNLTVKVSGPFFQLGPGPVLNSLHDAIQETVLTGEAEGVRMAQPRERGGVFHSGAYAAAHGYRHTGHYARSIHGRMTSTLNGVISDSGVVYGPWLEGVSSRNQATRFKGYAIFRRTRDKLQRLSRDILDKHVKKALGKLR